MCNFWKSILLLSFVSCLFFPLLFVRVVEAEKRIEFKPQVGIGEKFPVATPREIQKESTLIGQYIAAFYRYFIGAIAIIATVMIMWGGFLWLTAAGSASQIGIAKSRITNALIGLVLALGSYLILNTINPKLVRFEPLTITPIEKIELEIPEIGGEGVVSCTIEEDGRSYEGKLFTFVGAEEVTGAEATALWATATFITGGPIKGAIVAEGAKRAINWVMKGIGEAWVGGDTCNNYCHSGGKYMKKIGNLEASKGGKKIEAVCCVCAEAKIKLDPEDETPLISPAKTFFCHPEFVRFKVCGTLYKKAQINCLGTDCHSNNACVRTDPHKAACKAEIELKIEIEKKEYIMSEIMKGIKEEKKVPLPCGRILSFKDEESGKVFDQIGVYCPEKGEDCVIDLGRGWEKLPIPPDDTNTQALYKFKVAKCL